MVNGAAAHALDFDDQHDPARVHSYCVIFPVTLAVAEEVGNVSGADFLAAIATGVELNARLGLACYNSVGKGWHPTTTLGVIAAGVAAARVLNLDVEQLINAVGLCYHQASGTQQSLRDGVFAKRLGPGFAARSAVLATFLAKDGVTGPYRALEGAAGLFPLYERNEVDVDVLTSDLGRRWHTLEYSLKPYPCCRCNHTIIDLALQLKQKGLDALDIDRAEILLSKVNVEAVGQPYDPVRISPIHAQFNAAYSFARALTDGRVTVQSYELPYIADSEVCELARRVITRTDARIAENLLEPARIRIRLKDGRRIEVHRATVKGSPKDPMSKREVLEKFRTNLEIGLGAPAAAADRLAEVVSQLERFPNAAGAIIRAFPKQEDADGVVEPVRAAS